ncbi:MAG: HEAT repeat domain-containing protein [Cyanobacterium sp. T60_A2020_053]|nr:HEAT repeat domain-containing protein [Cyanobacterium sp. T60_A2020_053]
MKLLTLLILIFIQRPSPLAIAQNTAPLTPSTQEKIILYDENMQKGYEATRNKEYGRALEYFNTALSHRPDDFYAQQAINNIQNILARSNSNDLLENNSLFTILLIGVIFLIILMAVTLIIISLRLINLSDNKKIKYRERKTESLSSSSVIKLTNKSTQLASSSGQLVQRIKPELEENIDHSDETKNLIRQLLQVNGNDRNKIIWRLATGADSRAIQPLLDIMAKGNSREKALILEAISQIAFNTLKPINEALIISLQDEQGEVRKNAIRDITKLYELVTQIQPLILQTAHHDPDPEVKEVAHLSLQQLGFINQVFQQNNLNYQQEIEATLIDDQKEKG